SYHPPSTSLHCSFLLLLPPPLPPLFPYTTLFRSPRPFELPACRRVRSSWSGRHRGHLRFARRLKPGDLRRVAQKSACSLVREIVERSAEVARQRGYDRRTHRIVRALFALRA